MNTKQKHNKKHVVSRVAAQVQLLDLEDRLTVIQKRLRSTSNTLREARIGGFVQSKEDFAAVSEAMEKFNLEAAKYIGSVRGVLETVNQILRNIK